MSPRFSPEKAPKILFVISICALAYFWGVAAHKFDIFPQPFLNEAGKGAKKVLHTLTGKKSWYYSRTTHTEKVPINKKEASDGALTLLTAVDTDNGLTAKIISFDGKVIKHWNLDWFTNWPEPKHLTTKEIPQSRPGVHIHGAALMDNGDLIFNFERLGLVRIDQCDNIVWRLPYRTHHSVHPDEKGNLWVPGLIDHHKRVTDLPFWEPPFIEPTLLKVSQHGEIIEEISILNLMRENGLQSLLYLTSSHLPLMTNDTLHLNDIETFPTNMTAGIFGPGDVLVSLRNINTVLVFNIESRKLKYRTNTGLVRQHDPDFLDGNTLSIFDNNFVGPKASSHQSRIIMNSAINDTSTVYYTGTQKDPFFSNFMGKHQWLDDGNLLITESMWGRAFEIDKDGNKVWEYINIVEDGYTAILEEAQRLDAKYDESFFRRLQKICTPHLATKSL